MAIYKIFPEKSATLYSFYPTINTGLPLVGQQVPLDLDEYARDVQPDMGCYEYH